MKNNLESIESQCGISPGDTSFKQIESNPNYIFENDPSFETIVLYDVDGNIVNVNSWVECAHYVNGGWLTTYNEGLSGNLLFLSIVILITSSYFVIRYFKFNKKSYEK